MKFLLTLTGAILFCFILLFTSCKKDAAGLQNAILTGQDLRLCACCGGVMITFTDNDSAYRSTFYDIDSTVPNSIITDSMTFPKYVKVKWHFETTGCYTNHVAIDEIANR